MKRYMLDTNMVSHVVKGNPHALVQLTSVPMAALCISSITLGEIYFGLAKRPEATRLHDAIRELLRRIQILPWDGTVAETYGALRAEMALSGQVLGSLDMLIAGHALHIGAILATSDKAFRLVPRLTVVDWTQEHPKLHEP
ncbi:MAG TPA: type II toxin-antitoxin system VapC family toxin [Burkholderiaceae bacterium]|nr:type II toxin-antitoxin system VapC family toxin [Burkholderiaceae bacterium]